MIAAAVVRHRQGGVFRVHVWTGSHARRDRTAWLADRGRGSNLKIANVGRVLEIARESSGSPAAVYVHIDGVDIGVRDVPIASWRKSVETVVANHASK